MAKARGPVVEVIAPSIHGSAEHTQVVVTYPDCRVAPRVCEFTGAHRSECWCKACRKLRRRKHGARCACWRCLCDRMGETVDMLGGRTFAGRWLWFITMSFRTGDHRWQRGFPILNFKPSGDFANRFFRQAVECLNRETGGPVEYFLAHQYGSQNGRLHLHFGVSWPNMLFEWRWKEFEAWLWKDAGFNRILPWQQGAAFYLSRYVGRAVGDCHWDFKVGREHTRDETPVGRRVVAESAELSSKEYRRTLRRWHR